MSRGPVATQPLPRDAGMTMAEVLVSMMLFAVLGSVLLSFAMATARVTDRIQVSGDLTGESRLAFQRFSRELRQASDIRGVQFSTGTGTTTAITFWTDFNGNGVVDLDASDPEVLTYRWDPDSQRLTLTANDASGTAVTRPVLAGSPPSTCSCAAACGSTTPPATGCPRPGRSSTPRSWATTTASPTTPSWSTST